MMELYQEIHSLPCEPGDDLERVVTPLMLWSDVTQLANFGVLAINRSTQGVAPQHLHAIMLHIYQRFVDIAKVYGNVVLIGLHSYQMTFRTSTVHFMGGP